MAKTYNYSLKELTSLLKLLKTYQHTCPEIDEDIANLTYFINYLYPNRKKKKKIDINDYVSIPTLLKEDVLAFTYLKPFEYFMKEFAWIGETIKDLAINPAYQEITISNKEAVTEATSFLSSHGPLFQEPLEEFSENIKSRLKFLKTELEIGGGALYIQSTGDAFVYAPDKHDIRKPAILTHELQHIIDFYNNPAMFDNFITREVIPVFMEMISIIHYALKHNAEKDAYQRILSLHSILKERALMYIEKIELLDITKKYQNLSDEDLYKLLKDNGYSRESLINFIELDIKDFYYQIPELIAIELFFLYQEDKKRAIAILEDISLHGNDTNLLDLVASHNLKLTKHMPEFEYHILSKAKR